MAATRASSKTSAQATKPKECRSASKVKKPIEKKKKQSIATRSIEKNTVTPKKRAGSSSSPVKKNTGIKNTATRSRRRIDSYQDCTICAETKPLGRNNANFPIFSTCEHTSTTCSECVTKYLLLKLKTSAPLIKDSGNDKYTIDWSRCTCPQCNSPLPENEIMSRLSRQQMVAIDTIITNKSNEADPNWIWCLSNDCFSGQRVTKAARKKSPQVTCIKCGNKSCFHHRTPWHEGYTCARYDDEHPNALSARSSEERIKRITKKCPNRACGWRIQKAGGCPGMYCPRCSRSFNWNNAKYDKGVTPEPEGLEN